VPNKKVKLPLSKTHPELSKEAYGWDPSKVSPWGNKKLAWKCPLSHIYMATPAHRCYSDSNCPFCSGNKVFLGFNDLNTTHPELSKEAYGWDPTLFSKGSQQKVEWRCNLKHIWQAAIYSRALGKNGCPFCGRKKVLKNFNDLATTHPNLAKEAVDWDPSEILSGNSKNFKWKCSLGHTWRASPSSRTNMKTGCPVCSGRQVQKGINDLATTHPSLILELVEADPKLYVAGSHKKVKWKCPKNHIYEASIRSRALRNTGCGVCSNNRSERYFNDLATTHPKIANEAFGWDPSSVTAGSSKKFNWKCSFGHIFSSSVTSRTSMHTKCPICSGHQLLIGFNDLNTLNPDIAAEAYGWDPKTVGISSRNKVQWKCAKSHIYLSSIKSRVGMKSGCAICANQKCLTGYNDMETTHPELAKEAYGWDPSLVIAGSGKKLRWICANGHIWQAKSNNRTSSAQSGCPSCAKFGFNPNEDGFLYFMENKDLKMLQIGITNFPKDRITSHSRTGWELIEIRGPMEGTLIKAWEQAILKMLKSKGADLANEEIAGKFDGYSEAWSKSTFPVKSIKELMRLTEEFEERK